MGANVRIDDFAFSDTRFDVLARLAGLADSDHARGKMARLWRQATLEGRYELSVEDVQAVLGENGVGAIISARLGEQVEGGFVRICGTKGRIEWFEKVRRGAQKGGKSRILNGKRLKNGRLASSSPRLEKASNSLPAQTSSTTTTTTTTTDLYMKGRDSYVATSSALRADSQPEDDKDPPILELDLIPRDGRFAITQKLIEEWTLAFPGVNVICELKKACQWARDNPSRRKTKSGARKYLGSWLGRAQDKSRGNGGSNGKTRSAFEESYQLVQEMINDRKQKDFINGGVLGHDVPLASPLPKLGPRS